eukprot:CAMPEP_0171286868 /NCGR_PEP_ID=MMETSP0790-20130122/69246_1 /TAXON_ID=2925 /ORGANISM="Alexandrium catenella, Strain OF101" /LENGTH=491 /DNA_ID=CAMNT_0011756349 /DNA_START=77 /DNA_END=1552 /DNA_ORIENTATION=+
MAPKAAAAKAEPKAEPKAKAKADAKKKAKAPKPEEEEIPKVPQPDNDEFKQKLDAISQEIEALSKERAALSEQINSRSHGGTEFGAQKAELRAQLNELSGKMDTLQEQKTEINKAVGDKVQEGKEMRQQLNKMKKSIGYTSESQIDDRIAAIDFKLTTDTMPLKEEKELLKEIQDLKRNRPKVGQVNRMEEGLQGFDKGGALKDNIQNINGEMFSLREQKRAIQGKLSELMDSRKEQLGDLPDIIAKKEELGKKIGEKVQARNQLRDDFKAGERAYYAYQGELRRIRAERAASERQAWQAEQERGRMMKKAEKLDEQPYVAEVTLIEQTILFCKSLIKKDEKNTEEKKETIVDAPEGMQLLGKKEDRDEFWFAPTAKKKAKGGKKQSEGSSRKPIKHNAETFRLFDQLKLDAPITTDDIPATLEKLEAKLEEYQAKVKKWEETRDERKRRILEGIEDPEEEKKEEAKEEEKEDAKEEAKEEAKEDEDKAED